MFVCVYVCDVCMFAFAYSCGRMNVYMRVCVCTCFCMRVCVCFLFFFCEHVIVCNVCMNVCVYMC